MRKALPYLGASLSALAMAWSAPALAQDQAFKDLDQNHWAYHAVTHLQEKGILKGYPDGYFRGKRTLTRYEFAVAIDRMLHYIDEQAKGTGPPGPQGEQGPPGPPGPGVNPEDLANLRRLVDEFRNELAALGANVRDINNRLDALSKRVDNLEDRVNRMLQWSGNAFVGFRSNQSRYAFFDYSGAPQAASQSLFSNVTAVHDLQLGLKANLPGGVTFKGALVESNYQSYRSFDGVDFGASAANQNGLASQTDLYEADLNIPIEGLGKKKLADPRPLQEPGHPADLLPRGHGCLFRPALVR